MISSLSEVLLMDQGNFSYLPLSFQWEKHAISSSSVLSFFSHRKAVGCPVHSKLKSFEKDLYS